jgi:hypothetical protein
MKRWFLLFLITFLISSTQAADVVVYKGTFRAGGSFEETPILPRSGSAYFVVDYTTGHSWIIYYFNKNGRRQRSAIADWNMTRAPLVDGRFATVLASGESRNTSLTDFNYTLGTLTGTNLPVKIQASPERTVSRPRALTGSYALTGGTATGDGGFRSVRFLFSLQSALTQAANDASKPADTVAGEIATKLQTQGYEP